MAALATRPDPQRRPALACGVLLCVTVLLVAFGRAGHVPRQIDESSVVERIGLTFHDLPDGTVVAIDADTGAELERIRPGEGGFIRVTMRSFASERTGRGLDHETPFDLLRMSDGDLVLTDRLTGRVMLLDAFGPSNEGVFAQLLEKGRVTQ
jgi:putative photosynthetic complex assembly protein